MNNNFYFIKRMILSPVLKFEQIVECDFRSTLVVRFFK